MHQQIKNTAFLEAQVIKSGRKYLEKQEFMEFLMFEIEFSGGFKQLMKYIEGFINQIDSKKEQILINGLGDKPIFITHYPDPLWNHGKKIEVEKFFNMLPDPENPGRVLSCDLILPLAGEAVGAAARVHQLA